MRALTAADLAMLPNGVIDALPPLAEPQLSGSHPCGHCGGFGKRLDTRTGEIVTCNTCGGTGVVTT